METLRNQTREIRRFGIRREKSDASESDARNQTREIASLQEAVKSKLDFQKVRLSECLDKAEELML